MSLFAPAYLKEADLVLKNARKLLNYKRDILPPAKLAEFEATIARLQRAIQERNRPETEAAAQALDTQWGSYLPDSGEAGWRENCEVFLVAIVIAVAVRTFFLQPFTIPTGSMQPTLDGIIATNADPGNGHSDTIAPPNVLKQIIDFAVRGRKYVHLVAKSDGVVGALKERKLLVFFTVTDVMCGQDSYSVWMPARTLAETFSIFPGRSFHAGEVLANGYVDAGDHVFVDKLSYNFRAPHRGEIFVFNTRGIPYIERDLRRQGLEGSEFYIKRLAGLPGDTLRVDAPNLYINGQLAQEFGFRRVMSRVGAYTGYTNPNFGQALYLTSPDATFHVPEHKYFAMGDNSANSSDSRYWGTVPEENLMGRGLFVYWPFLPHWGFAR